MPYITTEVEVWIDLDEIDTDDLIQELESRDISYRGGNLQTIRKIYEHKQLGKDIEPLLNELFYNALNRIA